jgi:hypothetical protein
MTKGKINMTSISMRARETTGDAVVPDIVLVSAPSMEHTPAPPAGVPCLVGSLVDHGFTAAAIDGDMIYKRSMPLYGFYYKCLQGLFFLRDCLMGNSTYKAVANMEPTENKIPADHQQIQIRLAQYSGDTSSYSVSGTQNGNRVVRWVMNLLRHSYSFLVVRLINMMNNAAPRVGWLLTDILDSVAAVDEKEESRLRRYLVPEIEAENAGVVGISIVYPDQLSLGLKLAKVLKQRNKDLNILIGGAQITAHISKIKDAPQLLDHVDAMMVKEAEVGLREYLSALRSGEPLNDIANLYYKDGDRFKASSRAEFLIPLSEYRVPDFRGFRIRDYGRLLPIRTLRGCYYNQCTFCTYPITGGKFAYTSSEFVVDNMIQLEKKYGVANFELIDSSMPAKYLKDIAELILERGLNVSWSCRANVQVEFLDSELLVLIRKAGLTGLYLGVESGNERIVKAMKKMQARNDNKTTEAIVKALYDHGITPYIYNMFGFPTETMEEMQGSLEFIMMLNRNYGTDVRFANQFNLEEDTPLFKNPKAFGVTKITSATRGSQGHGYHYEVASGATASEVAAFCKIAKVFLRHPSLYIFRRFFGWSKVGKTA